MNLDSDTVAQPPEAPDQATPPRRPWGMCALKCLVIYWASLCAWIFFMFYSDSTLDHLVLDDVTGILIMSTMFGTAGILLWFVLPVLLTSFLLRRWPRFRSGVFALVWLGLNTASAIFMAQKTPEKRFEVITHMDWNLAPCVADFHNGSIHLWVFKGTPESFEKHLSALPWQKQEGVGIWQNQDDTIYLRKARKAFGSDPWEPQEHYHYIDDRRFKVDTTPPYGNAHLLVDAERQRWMIWWDQM